MSPSPLSRIRRDGDALDEARPPAPFVVGLTRSGTTLLRMMLDAHPAADDPARDPLRPRPDQGGPGRAGHRRDARGDDLEPDLGATSGSTTDEMRERLEAVPSPATAAGGRPRLLRGLRRAAGQAALGRQDARLHALGPADRPDAAGVAVHPPDPRRPRRRPLADAPGRSTSSRRRPSRPARWVKRIREVARAGRDAEGRRATSRPATRTSSATRRRRCGGSASSSTCRGTRRC